MTWTVNYLPEAQDELESFDKAQQKTIQKAIKWKIPDQTTGQGFFKNLCWNTFIKLIQALQKNNSIFSGLKIYHHYNESYDQEFLQSTLLFPKLNPKKTF